MSTITDRQRAWLADAIEQAGYQLNANESILVAQGEVHIMDLMRARKDGQELTAQQAEWLDRLRSAQETANAELEAIGYSGVLGPRRPRPGEVLSPEETERRAKRSQILAARDAEQKAVHMEAARRNQGFYRQMQELDIDTLTKEQASELIGRLEAR